MNESPSFLVTRTLPEHGYCFVCGQENPRGIGITWHAGFIQAEPGPDGFFPPGTVRIFSDFQFTLYQQGPPGHAHGGASAAVIDEAMGATIWQSGYRALLAHYELDYAHPVPLNVPLRVEAWLERVDGRKLYARGHILLPDGRIAVQGQGLYLHIPHFFQTNSPTPSSPQPPTS